MTEIYGEEIASIEQKVRENKNLKKLSAIKQNLDERYKWVFKRSLEALGEEIQRIEFLRKNDKFENPTPQESLALEFGKLRLQMQSISLSMLVKMRYLGSDERRVKIRGTIFRMKKIIIEQSLEVQRRYDALSDDSFD